MDSTTTQTPDPSLTARETVVATEAPAAPEAPAAAPVTPEAPADPVTAEAAQKAAQASQEAAAKEARKTERRTKNGELSDLARATIERFGATRQARDAQTQAQKSQQDAERAVQDAAKKAQDLEAALEEARRDPWTWAKKQGLTPQQVAEMELAADTPDARVTAKFRELEERQAAADRRVLEAEAKAKAAEERVEAIVKDARDRQEAADRAAKWEETKRTAYDNFSKEKEKYPHLYRICPNPNAFARKMIATKNELDMHEDPEIRAASRAGLYSEEDIAEYIEHQFKTPGAQAAPALTPAVATAGGAAPNGSAAAQKVGDGSAPATVAPTLTSADTASASTANGWPADFDTWDDRKQNKWIAAAMKNGTLPVS